MCKISPFYEFSSRLRFVNQVFCELNKGKQVLEAPKRLNVVFVLTLGCGLENKAWSELMFNFCLHCTTMATYDHSFCLGILLKKTSLE